MIFFIFLFCNQYKKQILHHNSKPIDPSPHEQTHRYPSSKSQKQFLQSQQSFKHEKSQILQFNSQTNNHNPQSNKSVQIHTHNPQNKKDKLTKTKNRSAKRVRIKTKQRRKSRARMTKIRSSNGRDRKQIHEPHSP